MPLQTEVKKEINQARVDDATGFIMWISNSIPNICDSQDKEEAIKEFISSKLTPAIAEDILKQDEMHNYVERFRSCTKENPDAELKLFSLATKDKKYPAEYAEVIRSLIFLYQTEQSQEVTLKVIYDLLLIPEFRKAFKNDSTFAPFFMNGFYDALSTYIENNCQNPELKKELLDACLPNPQDSKAIDAELMRVFGYKEPLEPEQKDIIAIQKFLANVTADSPVLKHLQLLENELEKEAGKRYNSETKLLEGYIEGQPYKHKKLFSGFLRQWAEKNGFLGYGKLKGLMSVDGFFNFIAKGGLFKDPVLRGERHGEFTHAIQWYLITAWNNEDPHKPKLNCHPTRLLQWMGENEGKFKEWSGTFEASIKSLYKPTSKDFRKVFTLPEYLNSPDCSFPILHQLNLGRFTKGKREFLMDVPPEFEEFKKPKGKA
ncbi:MAG TPA: LirA/MavJ family T4SS effector [Gammaproteobacteria bacterium]|nr:LirA/MavJ family T4SS effector [Gammaproteobacteria bacterium]